MTDKTPDFPGIPDVTNGNGAVTHVMKHVCGGVIGYPITPSTEISEIFEAARAEGQLNLWGKHPFFVEAEGEHSAQSGALGAALVGGNFVSNASSSQGILYALESHFVTAGKKIGGFVLQVAARVVAKHSLNVMAGHDDVYALLPSGYTVLFGSNPQEAADLAAISYRVSALSLIPVANTFDGFATSHMMSEVLLPEPEMLRQYLGDPAGRIESPTVAQDILFGAKGRVFQLNSYLDRHAADFDPSDLSVLRSLLESQSERVEADQAGTMISETFPWVPNDLHEQWNRQWVNAWSKGTRQLVPALMDPHNPGMTGPVQNQPDFQAGAVDHRTHFASAVPSIVNQAMAEYAGMTGREYTPVHSYDCEDADYVMVGLGSITDDVRAVLPYLRAKGLKVGLVSVKLLHPFPEAELVAALSGAKNIMVLERSDDTALSRLVTQSLFKATVNANDSRAYPGIPAMTYSPRLTTAILGLGGHDVQPRHLVAAFENLASGQGSSLIYLGSQFFSKNPSASAEAIENRMRAAYPETEAMALETGPNPPLLPPDAIRLRFHSVGGYGTVATGKLLTDILGGVLDMRSKSAPKYGSEKSGAATNYFITLSPEPVLLTNAELEDVEVVIAPDHQVFAHSAPLKGLVPGGTFIIQADIPAIEVWRAMPAYARRTIRERKIRLFIIDAFSVARKHAPTPELETRMMGIAFIGAVIGHVDRISKNASPDALKKKVREQIVNKFGRKGEAVVEGNMAVINDGISATVAVDYDDPAFLEVESAPRVASVRTAALSAAMSPAATEPRASGLFDPGYYEDLIARPFREGTIAEAPVLPGTGMFMPTASGAFKDKGIFRRTVPVFDPAACTGCLECALACPDAAIPNTVHEIHDLLLTAIATVELPAPQREVFQSRAYAWAERIRQNLRATSGYQPLSEVAREAAADLGEERAITRHLDEVVAALSEFPVARTRPFFDSLEKETPGTGALFSAVIDPWKCTGCLQCVEVCGPAALTSVDQDAETLTDLETRFERMTALPNSPKRFTADATQPDGDTKRIMLDHANYYAMTGGHGACRGCGEVTATRMVLSLNRALAEERRRAHIVELESLIQELRDKVSAVADPERSAQITTAIAELERRLYLYESGPTGQGPSPTVIANSTGCSSVYASTMPSSPFIDPWVNSLFQDAQALAVGLFEGLVSQTRSEAWALRVARLELDDASDAARAEAKLSTFSWRDFTPAEMTLLPTVLTISGDGAAYDIGFGAMSRVLASGTPIKALVLDSGAYSNTGGQASTASFTGQDSDLARFGKAHSGKRESRKELGLLAAFHPNVFACATSTALHSHFLTTAMSMLSYSDGTALMNVYTPCGTENGFTEDLSTARSRLAVESRMHPVYVHDPRLGATFSERLSLEGNPDADKHWTTITLEYIDDTGQLQLMQTPLTPAEFALGEGRFAKQFRRLNSEDDSQILIADYIELTEEQREGKMPYVLSTNADRRLIRVSCSAAIVALVEDRLRNWQLLQFLSGQNEARLLARHRDEMAEWTAQYTEATTAREHSLDAIAEAMAELAASSGAPVGMPVGIGAGSASMPAGSAAAVAPPGESSNADRPVWLDPTDLPLCNDCGTCYQELPQLFEKTTIIVDGAAQVVGQMIPGSLDGLEVTPELTKRITRVRANCDAEIIQ